MNITLIIMNIALIYYYSIAINTTAGLDTIDMVLGTHVTVLLIAKLKIIIGAFSTVYLVAI